MNENSIVFNGADCCINKEKEFRAFEETFLNIFIQQLNNKFVLLEGSFKSFNKDKYMQYCSELYGEMELMVSFKLITAEDVSMILNKISDITK